MTHLIATQHADGGWGQLPDDPSDVLSTAQAVPVLARHGDPLSVSRAVTYLLNQQDPDGGFTSPPDQVGPRPLPFDYPVLTDIHALSALRSARLPTPESDGRLPHPERPEHPVRTGRPWKPDCTAYCSNRSRPPTNRLDSWSTSASTTSDRRRSRIPPTSTTSSSA
ncbi:prenyltransferase/squalene oxidase repeat-containing protein [Streptomyces sp. NPDC057798]|uniref:prenyltransferase/squalene oxidase repeat-containing protein n=1 Tax=Streptomyces sp. NPDC057798 TaxID=3346252 RepID=UPI003681C643